MAARSGQEGNATSGGREPAVKILSLGLARTGTASMAEAYRILGYKTHHGITLLMENPDLYEPFGRAADACFPTLKSYHGRAFTPADWDKAFGDFEAVTDLAAYFGPWLVEAYPDAKVVLVERDLDKWLASIEIAININYAPYAEFFAHFFEPLVGSKIGPASYKLFRGFFEADSREQARANAPRLYRRHYDAIRAAVSPESLLNFRIQDGWEPLCRFLDAPIPDVPFPHVNEAEEFQKLPRIMITRYLLKAVSLFGPWLAVAGVVALLAWFMQGRR